MHYPSPMLYFGLHWSEQLRVAPEVELTDEQEIELTRLARSKRTSVRLAQRTQIVLLAAQGLQNKDIAEQLGVGRVQVARWRERYLESGLQGIERDLPRGAPPVKVNVARLVELTTQSTPEILSTWSSVLTMRFAVPKLRAETAQSLLIAAPARCPKPVNPLQPARRVGLRGRDNDFAPQFVLDSQ